jgi:hypothetical protein
MSNKLTDAEREGLSPEEIEAIESEEGDELDDLLPEDEAEEDTKAEEGAKAEEDEDTKAKEPEDKDEDRGEKPPEKPEDEKKPEEPEKKEEPVEKEKTDETVPFIPQVKIVEDEEFEKLKVAFDDAKKKFDEGDINYAELDEAKDAYNQAKWKREYAEESNRSIREARWKWEQENFLNDKANKVFLDNETLNVAFVGAVNKIIATEESAKMTDREVLEAAKQKVQKDLGVLKPASDADTKEKDKAEAIRKAKEKNADKTAIPKDLTGVPEAEENIDENEFAYLDRLEGDKFQAAIDKLTPAQLERYENAH